MHWKDEETMSEISQNQAGGHGLWPREQRACKQDKGEKFTMRETFLTSSLATTDSYVNPPTHLEPRTAQA